MAETPRPDMDGTPPRRPRWVTVAAVVVGLLVLLFVVLQVTGIAGEHGPGRHLSGLPAVVPSPAAAASG